MRPSRVTAAVLAGMTLLVGAGSAGAEAMHPKLAARLSGMGEHGVVNLQTQAAKGRLCWRFQLHTSGITRASIRDAAGMKLVELGMHYTANGCGAASRHALQLIEAHPGRYRVWVDTKGHPGDLRGKLFAGTAQM
jgi:hypothetical protein